MIKLPLIIVHLTSQSDLTVTSFNCSILTVLIIHSYKIVTGDWNANMLEQNESDIRFVTDLMNDLSLKLVNTGPSHHNIDDNDTWIDTIFIDNYDTAKSYDRMLPTFPSRHEIISVTIDIFYPSSPNVKTVYRAFNKITAHDLNSHLSKLN